MNAAEIHDREFLPHRRVIGKIKKTPPETRRAKREGGVGAERTVAESWSFGVGAAIMYALIRARRANRRRRGRTAETDAATTLRHDETHLRDCGCRRLADLVEYQEPEGEKHHEDDHHGLLVAVHFSSFSVQCPGNFLCSVYRSLRDALFNYTLGNWRCQALIFKTKIPLIARSLLHVIL